MHVLVIRNNSNPQATEASLLLGAYLGMQGIESSLVDSRDLVGPAEIGEVRRLVEGGIDLAGMLKNIPDPPYYSIELPNAAEVAIRGKLEHARRCLETAKTFFAAHQI